MTYVIGHQRPDTDAIASALGYAWFLTAAGEANVMAARAGQPGEQAIFALKRFEQTAPTLLSGVAPTFGTTWRRNNLTCCRKAPCLTPCSASRKGRG